jgi:hypothetical protein
MNEAAYSNLQRKRLFKSDMGTKVYITISRLKNILSEIPMQSLSSLTGTLYKRNIFIFSDRERLRLMAVKSFFEDSEAFIGRYWKPATWGQNPHYVFPDEQPVYHLHKNCDRLYSDYNNIEIPAHIRNRGKEAIDSFRKWATANKAIFLDHPERFKLMICTEFDIPLTELNLVFFENSGAAGVVNENLNAISIQIDRILREAGKFYYASPKNTAILGQYQKYASLGYYNTPLHSNRTGYSEDEVKKFLREYNEQYKKPLKKLLTSYFCVHYNPELSFNGFLLEELGLRCCQACGQTNYLTTKDKNRAAPQSSPAPAPMPEPKKLAAESIKPACTTAIQPNVPVIVDDSSDDNDKAFESDDVLYF